MIRPEKYQFNWKPKYNSDEDLELVRSLEKLVKEYNLIFESVDNITSYT